MPSFGFGQTMNASLLRRLTRDSHSTLGHPCKCDKVVTDHKKSVFELVGIEQVWLLEVQPATCRPGRTGSSKGPVHTVNPLHWQHCGPGRLRCPGRTRAPDRFTARGPAGSRSLPARHATRVTSPSGRP